LPWFGVILNSQIPCPVVLACLPYEAWFSLDAIRRTLSRLGFSRRHLLQWAPSSQVERTLTSGWSSSLRSMAVAPVFALGAGLAIHWFNPAALGLALPEEAAETEIPDDILALAEERQNARTGKNWARSDELRDQLAAHGWIVKDSKTGYTLEPG
jgi:hypothetical protein